MFSYIINESKSSAHFSKTNDLSAVRSEMQDETKFDNIKHVYRIDDVTKAINTSVLLDFDQKSTYNTWLSSNNSQFDANDDFVNICREVGECDIQ